MASRAWVTVRPATCTSPYCRRLIVPSGPTRYWPVSGCEPETRASCTETSGLLEDIRELQFDGLLGFFDGHAHHADGAVGGAEVDHPFGLDDVVVVDGLIGEGIGDVDLQDVVDLGPIGGQGDDLEHFDIEDIGGFDAVDGQADVIFFAGRHLAGRHGRFEQVVMEVDGLAARQGDGCGGQHRPKPNRIASIAELWSWRWIIRQSLPNHFGYFGKICKI